MIENGKKVPLNFILVHHPVFRLLALRQQEAAWDLTELDELLQSDDILYLSEMMNFPGVVSGDELVAQKLALANNMVNR